MTSRHKLYAAGMPFGDCATARTVTGALRCGGGGDSSSSSASNTTTNNVDGRIAASSSLIIQGSPGGAGAADAGATAGTGTTVNAVINDPSAAIAAMDLVNTSTAAAITQMEAVSAAASQAAADAAMAASQASAAASLAAGKSVDGMRLISDNSLAFARNVNSDALGIQRQTTQGVFEFSTKAINQMFSGMDRILTAGDKLISAQQSANADIGKQIDTAYKTATDVSTGNKQLATAGMIVVGLMALFVMRKAT